VALSWTTRGVLVRSGVVLAAALIVAIVLANIGHGVAGRPTHNRRLIKARMLLSAVSAFESDLERTPTRLEELAGGYILPDAIPRLIGEGFELRADSTGKPAIEWNDAHGKRWRMGIGQEPQFVE